MTSKSICMSHAAPRHSRQAVHAARAAPFLRHYLLQAGYDIRTVQQLLGRSDVRTTMI